MHPRRKTLGSLNPGFGLTTRERVVHPRRSRHTSAPQDGVSIRGSVLCTRDAAEQEKQILAEVSIRGSVLCTRDTSFNEGCLMLP